MSAHIIKIYSENNDFQLIETLRRNREKRHKHQLFFVEGVRSINLARQFEWDIHAYVYTTEKALSLWAKEIIKTSQARFHYELPSKLLQKISTKEETSELIALIKIPQDNLEKIPVKENLLILVSDRPANPGNLGTIIRSADALHVDGIIITGHSVDLYDPETIQASTGSLFNLPITRLESHKELISWVENIKKTLPDLQIIGTDEKAETSIDKHDFKKPTLLLIGNETNGLSHFYKEYADGLVKIPMSHSGTASSLNVACATTTILYEINRQRASKTF